MNPEVAARFAAGTVIPAQPLALTEDLGLDERHQRALTRYYLAAGAGGLAVGVHTTQFAIHYQYRHLLEPVLSLAASVAREESVDAVGPILIAGACGPIQQACEEAELAARLGYHAILLAPYGLGEASEEQLLERSRAVAQVLPVIGFYLQPSVGGRVLSRQYWRQLAEIPGVVGIKVAPFNRYHTLEVLTGVGESGRSDLSLYTGNDDHIIGDLLLGYVGPDGVQREFVGGLLGQWSMWTREAVTILDLAKQVKAGGPDAPAAWERLRVLDQPLTDANGVIFDAAGGFRGCLPGIHEILYRQGLLAGRWCLDPHEQMSPGQLAEIDRIWAAYPQLRDDAFVAEHLDQWLA